MVLSKGQSKVSLNQILSRDNLFISLKSAKTDQVRSVHFCGPCLLIIQARTDRRRGRKIVFILRLTSCISLFLISFVIFKCKYKPQL